MTNLETNVLWKSALVDNRTAQAFADNLNMPLRVSKWFISRGVDEVHVRDWMNPTESMVESPTVFLDMELAVHRVKEAISRRERICVVGDYDVDGVTSSSIVCSTLEFLGADWICKIPHRIQDGYGLSKSIVDFAKVHGCTLLITVDNGIRAVDAIRYAAHEGIDVIVTDHHEPGEEIPQDALAVVHYARCKSNSQGILSGAGVAYKFSTHLLNESGYQYDASETVQELRNWTLGLAALGALADVMPMRGENRFIVQAGLALLAKSKRPGWVALCSVAGFDLNKCTDTSILWNITPRLNAAGRMDSAEVAFDLLMAKKDLIATQKAEYIEQLNTARRADTDRIYREAVAICESTYGEVVPDGIVVHGPWNLGIVGIVAAKLVNLYNRPVIVLADDGSDLLRGSGRAPDGFPLHGAVEACEDVLEHFGGHESAIGCGVHRQQVDAFAHHFMNAATQYRDCLTDKTKLTQADDYLPLQEATMELLKWVQCFSPFGPENEKLRFYIGPLEVLGRTEMGGGKHLRLKVREGDTESELVWFNAAAEALNWQRGDMICAVVTLEENTWKGVTKVQLGVESGAKLHRPLVRKDFGYFYKLLSARRRLHTDELSNVFPEKSSEEKKLIFDTFVELGFAHFDERAYHVIERVVPRDLRDSPSYHKHLLRAIGGP